MGALLLAVFGGPALLLASVGVYGVMAYAVSQRTRELGIRLALGATVNEVRGMVFRQGISLTLAGTGFGVLLSGLLANFVNSLLYGVSATDPVTFIVIFAVLLAVGERPSSRSTWSTISSAMDRYVVSFPPTIDSRPLGPPRFT
jgi:ABC-type antimicrobial peptide transport system permease subunit